MSISIKSKISFTLLALLALGLLCACGSSPAATPSGEGPSGSSAVSPIPDEPLRPADRVEVVYFHRPRRCVTCICFEERVSYVVQTYFQDELDSGKLTFEIFNLGNEDNAAIVDKYGAIGSQLFVNTIKEGVDHISDIQEIWNWDCRHDKEGFDKAVKNVIEQSLKGEL